MNSTPTKEELDKLGNTLLRLGVHLLLGPGGEYELYRSVPFGTACRAADCADGRGAILRAQ